MTARLLMASLFLALPIAAHAAVDTVDGKPATVANAPCDWFKKKQNNTWETSREVLVDVGRNAVRGLAFQKGVFKMDDGKDPYDVLESRCGGAK